MKEDRVYVIYDSEMTNIILNQGLDSEHGNKRRLWEYFDNNKFTITFSQDDSGKSTDIRILSKTKLKDRPKTVDVISNERGYIKGIFIRRSNSLSRIEDLFLIRRSPLIKPLLSEREIENIQMMQEECRKKRTEVEKIAIRTDKWTDGQVLDSDLTKDAEKSEHTSLEIQKEPFGQSKLPLLSLPRKRKLSPLVKGLPTDFSLTELPLGQTQNYKKTDISQKHRILPVKEKKAPQKRAKGQGGKISYDAATKNFQDKRSRPKGKSPVKLSISQKEAKKPAGGKTFDNTEKLIKTEKNLRTARKKTDNNDKSIKKGGSPETTGKPLKTTASTTKEQKSLETPEKPVKKTSSTIKGKKNIETTEKLIKTPKSANKEKKHFETTVKPSKSTKSRSKSNSSLPDGERSENKIEKTLAKKSDSSSTKQIKNIASGDSGSSDGKLKKFGMTESQKGNKSLEKEFQSEAKIKKGKSSNSLALDKKEKKVLELQDAEVSVKQKKGLEKEASTKSKGKLSKKTSGGLVQYIVHYVLSNPEFIDLGWTLQPIDRAQARVVTFKALPANPRTYCFRTRSEKEQKFHSSGDLAVDFGTDGTGKIYYANGLPAMSITAHKSGKRLTIYSNPKKDPLIKESFNIRILGIFDSFGNGVVYNENGETILNFNQLGGIYNNRGRKIISKWQWSDSKILEKQMIKELLRSIVSEEKTPSAVQGKKIPRPSLPKKVQETKQIIDEEYEQILTELPKPVQQKSKLKNENQTPALKQLILKINEEITLRINEQDSVVINFSSNKMFYKIDLGVKIDPETVEQIEQLVSDKLGDVPCVFQSLLHQSPSLQDIIPHVRHSHTKSVSWKHV